MNLTVIFAYFAAAAALAAGVDAERGRAVNARELPPLTFSAEAQAGSPGVFLDEVAMSTSGTVPHIRLFDAPRVGQAYAVSPAQLLGAAGCPTNVLASGAEQVRITRRSRRLGEDEIRLALMEQLQREQVKERGELDLRFSRPWSAVLVPDEPVTYRIFDMPASGVASLFTARVEVRTAYETVGTWQVSLTAKVWRDVWVSAMALRRGAPLIDADIVRERRDVLQIREPLAEFAAVDPTLEAAEYIAPQTPLFQRSIKSKPIVRRGQSADAVVQDGALAITMKVEILEDGLLGQVIRIRNPQSRRELRGRVQGEQTILVTL